MKLVAVSILIAAAGTFGSWLTASDDRRLINAAVAFAVALSFAVLSLALNYRMRPAERSIDNARLAARGTALMMAAVYVWGSTSILAAYRFAELRWFHAEQYVIYLAIPAIACILASRRLGAARGKLEPSLNMLRRLRMLAILQVVVAFSGIAYQLLTGKLATLKTDWVAEHVLFFGAAAILALSVIGLATERRLLPASPSGRG